MHRCAKMPCPRRSAIVALGEGSSVGTLGSQHEAWCSCIDKLFLGVHFLSRGDQLIAKCAIFERDQGNGGRGVQSGATSIQQRDQGHISKDLLLTMTVSVLMVAGKFVY